MFDIYIDLADESMPGIHERSIIDPEFKEGFFMYMTPDKKVKFIRSDYILLISISQIGVS